MHKSEPAPLERDILNSMNKTSDLGNPISGYRSLSIQLPEKVVSPEDAMWLTSREEVQVFINSPFLESKQAD